MITRLQIEHYKSLESVDIHFTPITALVGPNGCGKSNVVDALRFLRDALTGGLDHAISGRGGIALLRQYSPLRAHTISFRVEIEYPLYSGKTQGKGWYLLEISSNKESLDFFVCREEAEWESEPNAISDGNSKEPLAKEKNSFYFNPTHDGPIETVPSWLLKERNFQSKMLRARFPTIYPETFHTPVRFDEKPVLKEDLSNWGSIIKTMRKTTKGRQAITFIIEMMKLILPGLQNISVHLMGGYVIPQFLVKDTDDAKAHYFDPMQLSDGTLRLFGLLLTLYQEPRPLFLGLEEPEMMVHPGALDLLIEAFREVASGDTQIVCTSHSPQLLDLLEPEEIRAVEMRNGATFVSPLKETQLKIIRDKLLTIGELMVHAGLQPESAA